MLWCAPRTDTSFAAAINNHGVIAGWAGFPDFSTRAVIWVNGEMIFRNGRPENTARVWQRSNLAIAVLSKTQGFLTLAELKALGSFVRHQDIDARLGAARERWKHSICPAR